MLTMINKIVVILVLLINLSSNKIESGMTCKNHNNKSVDWFILYKLPKSNGSLKDKLAKRGLVYMYITSNSKQHKWTLSNFSISDSNSLLGVTLNGLYNAKPLYHILYNDQPPDNKVSESKGHTKGILVGDKQTSFWILHSIPHFPPVSNASYKYPFTAQKYGQIAVCITYKTKEVNEILKQFFYNDPKLYSSNFTDKKYINKKLSNLPILLNRTKPLIKQPPWNRSIATTSNAGKTFWSFVKYKRFNNDLYNDWLNDIFESDLFVESWLNSPHPLPSNCSRLYHVYNINTVGFSDYNFKFNSSLDHSKWVIDAKEWVCISDINRGEQQMHRSGGAICSNDKHLWKIFMDLVVQIDGCKIPQINKI